MRTTDPSNTDGAPVAILRAAPVPGPALRRRDALAQLPRLAQWTQVAAWTPLATAAPGSDAGLQAAGVAPVGARRIASTGHTVPCVGLGTWITFNVGRDPALRAECAQVVRAFLAGGGRLIDSSPMYGSAQEVVGQALGALGTADQVFAADKVWTGEDAAAGAAQAEESRRRWGVPRFGLLQVHNLLNWEAHLPRLLRMKAEGRVGHVGITTSEGRRHDDMERLMRAQPLDFVQLTYNPVDRAAEQRLLPLALERGIAVIVNRPFRQGALTRRLTREPLPAWAANELGARSWAQVVLKHILAHPAVTCVIPATSQEAHVRENLAAGSGTLPDAAQRERIAAHLRAL